MSSYDVVPADDARKYLATDTIVWFGGYADQDPVTAMDHLPEEHRWAVPFPEGSGSRADNFYAGIYGVYPLRVGVPGPLGTVQGVEVAGLTWVGVHPDRRRTGVLTALLGHHLEQAATAWDSGLSALHASETDIYGRFGYGVSSTEMTLTLSSGQTLSAPGLEDEAAGVATTLGWADEPDARQRMVALVTARLDKDLGSVRVEERVMVRFTRIAPHELAESERDLAFFATRDGVDVGFAWFRRKVGKWEGGTPDGVARVVQIVGDPAVQLALARRLLSLDLVGSAQIHRQSPRSPLVTWGGPRANRSDHHDSLWFRLADLAKAVAARGYAAPATLVLDVTDTKRPVNAGRWQFDAGSDGVGIATRTEAAADLSLDVEHLGMAYLGGTPMTDLVRAGVVTEHRVGAAEEFDRAWLSPLPVQAGLGF